jgi:NitT/TauT family transport system permease protein
MARMTVRAERSAAGDAQDVQKGLAQVELLQQAELERLGSRHLATAQAYLFPVLTFVAILALWQLASVVFDIPDYLLPAPVEIAQTMVTQQALLLDHSAATLVAILGGFLLSIVVGLPVSMLIVYSRHFERSVYPLIVTTQIIPKAAVAPLFVVWFGFGVTPKIIVAFLIAFFPVLIATVVGLKSTPREMLQLLRCMGASQIDIFVRARFPHALPSIFGGLKVGITLAVIGAVVGEFVGADEGLGYLIQVSQGAFDSKMLFAALTELSVIGIILFLIIWAVERLVLPADRLES